MWWLTPLALLASAAAQIPSLGWCPDYQPMVNFNMNRFLGDWHEAERYFTVSELGSRCVTTTYEKKPDGRVWVSNEIRNSFTGVKRVLDGTLQLTGREGEGKVLVKYSSLPVPYDTEYLILDTDYDSYAVIWSCSGIGPVHTQNAWVMTRERLAPAAIMQSAYGVLDKFKISRAFFVKTNQEDCSVLPQPVEPPLGKNMDDVVQPLEVVDKVVQEPVPVEQNDEAVVPVGKSSLAVERVAVPDMPEEPAKAPMPVPELIMKEAEKKKEKPMEEPPKSEPKPEMKPELIETEKKPDAMPLAL